MKRILCFGDSNTWGAVPGGTRWDRLPYEQRWTGRLQALLGDGYELIEEGCCGRTTVLDDPAADGRNGLRVIVSLLESHRPLDLVIVFLGTNDLKHRYQMTACDVAAGLTRLLKCIQGYPCGYGAVDTPQILVVSPTWITENAVPYWDGMYGLEAVDISHGLAPRMQAAAEAPGCAFLDAQSVTASCPIDGLHLDAAGHTALADALNKTIRGMQL